VTYEEVEESYFYPDGKKRVIEPNGILELSV